MAYSTIWFDLIYVKNCERKKFQAILTHKLIIRTTIFEGVGFIYREQTWFFLSKVRYDIIVDAWIELLMYERVDTWNKILQQEIHSKACLEQNVH